MYMYVVLLSIVSIISCSNGCGVKPYSARVVNRDDDAPNSWPWLVSLRVNGVHGCGGALIDPQWVVTAAHCVWKYPYPNRYTTVVGYCKSEFIVIVTSGNWECDAGLLPILPITGAHTRTGTTPYQRSYPLSRIFVHEKYQGIHSYSNAYDIALIKLSLPVMISPQVNTVCLPKDGSRAVVGSQCYITGWGCTIGGAETDADILQQARLSVVDDRLCDRLMSRFTPVDSNAMICAGGQGKGGCQGDSGGPFVCEEEGRWVLRGAVSWGHPECQTDHYTIFSRVSSFVDWIDRREEGRKRKRKEDGNSTDIATDCSRWRRRCDLPQVRAKCRKTCRLC